MKKIAHLVLTGLLAISVLGLPVGAYAQESISDPLEPMNRKIFWFNEKMDKYLLAPVAHGYDTVVPRCAQRKVSNFFQNLGYPKYLLSDLVQFKFSEALSHTGRFLINTTIGIGGLFDVASEMGLEHEDEDFGIALAYRGVPDGAYIVLPFFGPSNVRDAFGRIVDTLVHPFMILTYSDVPAGIADKITYGGRALDSVQTRVDLDEAIKAGKESSVDYYLFLQGAYTQYRRGVLYDGNPPDEYDTEDSNEMEK